MVTTVLNPTLSRRSFLGGAGASLAVTIAHAAPNPLLPPAPLATQVLLQGADGLAGLEGVLACAELEVRAILVAAPASRPSAKEDSPNRLIVAVRHMLACSGCKAPIDELQSALKRPSRPNTDLPLIMLGSFPGYSQIAGGKPANGLHQPLARLIRSCPWIYADNPLLAVRMTSERLLSSVAPRIVAGLSSLIDPTVDFAVNHLLSDALGEVTQISAGMRMLDAVNRLEAVAIHQRFAAALSETAVPALRVSVISSAHPSISVRGTRGALEVALYNPRERSAAFPMRLQRFTSILRGNVG